MLFRSKMTTACKKKVKRKKEVGNAQETQRVYLFAMVQAIIQMNKGRRMIIMQQNRKH